jgi:hypothetical protein
VLWTCFEPNVAGTCGDARAPLVRSFRVRRILAIDCNGCAVRLHTQQEGGVCYCGRVETHPLGRPRCKDSRGDLCISRPRDGARIDQASAGWRRASVRGPGSVANVDGRGLSGGAIAEFIVVHEDILRECLRSFWSALLRIAGAAWWTYAGVENHRERSESSANKEAGTVR